VTAVASGAVITMTDRPTYTLSTSVGATETMKLSPTYAGNTSVAIGGTPTVGDTLTITTNFSALTGGQEVNSYTVVTGDTLSSIAAQLVSKLSTDAKLTAIGLTTTANNMSLTSSKVFSGGLKVNSGSTSAAVSAIDGGSNSATNPTQLLVQGPATQSSCYDLNGNLVNDGTNTYLWDAENRLIQINYPGSGNNSQFTYDAYERVAQIVETVSGSVASTKQFVWANRAMREARNSSGTITAQYFNSGETIGGTAYYWTKDHLGSVKELTNSSGNPQAQYVYDLYGRATKIQGVLACDFQYAGYYYHAPSGFSICLHRFYNSNTGHWLNRDPIEEAGGNNLYCYVGNQPTQSVDPSGYGGIGILEPITGGGTGTGTGTGTFRPFFGGEPFSPITGGTNGNPAIPGQYVTPPNVDPANWEPNYDITDPAGYEKCIKDAIKRAAEEKPANKGAWLRCETDKCKKKFGKQNGYVEKNPSSGSYPWYAEYDPGDGTWHFYKRA
jgi:RHS repeat-associated protein